MSIICIYIYICVIVHPFLFASCTMLWGMALPVVQDWCFFAPKRSTSSVPSPASGRWRWAKVSGSPPKTAKHPLVITWWSWHQRATTSERRHRNDFACCGVSPMSRIQGLVSKVQCGNSFLITSQYLKHPKSGNHKHNTETLNLLSYLTSIYTW